MGKDDADVTCLLTPNYAMAEFSHSGARSNNNHCGGEVTLYLSVVKGKLTFCSAPALLRLSESLD